MKRPISSEPSNDENESLLKESALYKEFAAERAEILRHKWLESEKAGRDIGFEYAVLDWIVRFRSSWLEKRRRAHPNRANGSKP